MIYLLQREYVRSLKPSVRNGVQYWALLCGTQPGPEESPLGTAALILYLTSIGKKQRISSSLDAIAYCQVTRGQFIH
jgi:hypothetical protein